MEAWNGNKMVDLIVVAILVSNKGGCRDIPRLGGATMEVGGEAEIEEEVN